MAANVTGMVGGRFGMRDLGARIATQIIRSGADNGATLVTQVADHIGGSGAPVTGSLGRTR